MPDEPEAAGLLALLLLSEARAEARLVGGEVVLLRDQDRSLWNGELIGEGQAIVRACIRRDRPGPYQLEASIQAVHSAAATYEATDWPQIALLYDHLYAVKPNSMVALNRAIAVGEVQGAESALAALDSIGDELDGYHLLHAARGTMLRRLGRLAEAKASFERAFELAPAEEQKRFLAETIAQLSSR